MSTYDEPNYGNANYSEGKYATGLRFGYALLPTATTPTHAVQLAVLAESLGLHYVSLQADTDDVERHDLWALLSAIGSATSRIGLIAKGDDLPLRQPAQLAKAAASLDLLTNGRVELDLGARAFLAQQRGQNGEGRTTKEALAMLQEAIYLMRLLWSGERPLRFEGEYYSLDDVEPGLAPARRINVWLDGQMPQELALAGRMADGWIAPAYPQLQPNELAILSRDVDDGLTMAGRTPADLQRVWPIAGYIGDTESATPFHGTPKQWAMQLAEITMQVGIDTFVLMQGVMPEEEAATQLELFGREVMPLTRELVELAPGITITSGLSRAYQGAAASGATRAEDETDDVDWVDETSMESFPASDPPASSSFT